MGKCRWSVSLFWLLVVLLLINAIPVLASRVNTSQVTPEDALDETCLDAKTVGGVDEVTLDSRGWHNDNRAQDYGQHVTATLYRQSVRLDTLHIYQEKNDRDDCLVTFSQRNYQGKGLPDGSGFFGYFSDTEAK